MMTCGSNVMNALSLAAVFQRCWLARRGSKARLNTTRSREVPVKDTGNEHQSSVALASVADSLVRGGHCHDRITVQENPSREECVKNTGPADGSRPKV